MQMFYGLVNIPDFRPSQAHPLHRAKRKAIEKANPHFDLKEAGLKAAVLAILAAIACYPRIKAEHDMKHHPERFENYGKGKVKVTDKGDGGQQRRQTGIRNRERVVYGESDYTRKLEPGRRRGDWNGTLERGSRSR